MTDVTIDEDLEEAAYNFFDRSDGNVSVAQAVAFARLAYQSATRAEDPRVAEMEAANRVLIGICAALKERLKLDEEHRMRDGNYAAGHAAGMKEAAEAIAEMRREQDELRDVILSLAQGTGDAIEKINDESVLGKPPDWTEWRLNAREVIKRARAALARLDAKGGV